jgi:hypothetical protein
MNQNGVTSARVVQNAGYNLFSFTRASPCRDPEVARHRDLEPFAVRRPVDGRDSRLCRILEETFYCLAPPPSRSRLI